MAEPISQQSIFSESYNSYAGTDIRAMISMPAADGRKPILKTLGNLQTISYSIFREKYPVRALGHVGEKGRCLPESAKVLVQGKGLISIRDVEAGDIIYSAPNKWSRVLEATEEPESKEVFELQLVEGFKLEASSDHPIMTANGWKHCSELDPLKDLVGISSKVPEGQGVDVPDWIVAITAYLIGDGSLHRYPKKNGSVEHRISLEIAETEMDTIGADVAEYLSSAGIPFRDNFHKGQGSLSRSISVCKTGFAQTDWRQRQYNELHSFLCESNLYDTYSHTKFIPPILMDMNYRQTVLFLQKIFATDGCYSVSGNLKYVEANYTSTSRDLIEAIRVLLGRIGVHSMLVESPPGMNLKKNIIGKRNAYRLVISRCQDLVRFIERIGIFGKQDRVLHLVPLLKRRINDIRLSVTAKELRLKLIESKTSKFAQPNAKKKALCEKHELYQDEFMTPRKAFKAVQDLDPEMLPFVESLLEAALNKDEEFRFLSIKELKSLGQKKVYDLTVEGEEAFVANGIYVHNTRGTRTIAGSMVFTVFDRHVLFDLLRKSPGDMNTNAVSAQNLADLSYVMVDQLPQFDIVIQFANEYGYASELVIFGVEISAEGQVMSVEDLITENTVQYTATHMTLMRPGGYLSSGAQREGEVVDTFTSIMNKEASPSMQELIRKTRNPYR